ncbi:MAG: hypothetical protein C4305_01910 [Thermoleophilia bacterium]
MRGIGDELPPGSVELGQPNSHPLERSGELAHLVGSEVDHRLIEPAARDTLGRPLELPNAAREEPGAGVADDEHDEEDDPASDEQPLTHQPHLAQRLLERCREKQDRSILAHRHRCLGEAGAGPLQHAAPWLQGQGRLERDGIVLDVGRAQAAARVPNHAQGKRGLGEGPKKYHPSVRRARGVLEEVGVERLLLVLASQRGGAALERRQLGVHEPALQRGSHDQKDDGQGASYN